jgi:hypothetical protein
VLEKVEAPIDDEENGSKFLKVLTAVVDDCRHQSDYQPVSPGIGRTILAV